MLNILILIKPNHQLLTLLYTYFPNKNFQRIMLVS